MDEFSYWQAAKGLRDYEDSHAFQLIASEAVQLGEQQKLEPQAFRWGLGQVFNAYGTFLSAMNPTVHERKDQLHWYNRFASVRLGKKLGEPPMFAELISDAAHRYLKGPMRVPAFDRALLDAFIAQETFAFIDRSVGRGAFLFQFGCFGVMMVGSIVGAVLFDEAVNWARYGQVIGGALLLFLVIWAWPKRGPYALFREMRDAYQLLTGSVVSVPELRRRVERARDKGVVWPAELYAVLDDVETRTKIL